MSQTSNPPSCNDPSMLAKLTSLSEYQSSSKAGDPPQDKVVNQDPWDDFLRGDGLDLDRKTASAGEAIFSEESPASAQRSPSPSASSFSSASWDNLTASSEEYHKVGSDAGSGSDSDDLNRFDDHSCSSPGNEPHNPSGGYGLSTIFTNIPSLWEPQGDSHPFISRPASLARSYPSTSTSDDGPVPVSSIFSKAVSKLKRRMSDPEGPSENAGSGATGATGKGGKPRWYWW